MNRTRVNTIKLEFHLIIKQHIYFIVQFMKNATLLSMNIHRQLTISPFITEKSKFSIQKSHFLDFYQTFFIGSQISVHYTKFSNFLGTPLQIEALIPFIISRGFITESPLSTIPYKQEQLIISGCCFCHCVCSDRIGGTIRCYTNKCKATISDTSFHNCTSIFHSCGIIYFLGESLTIQRLFCLKASAMQVPFGRITCSHKFFLNFSTISFSNDIGAKSQSESNILIEKGEQTVFYMNSSFNRIFGRGSALTTEIPLSFRVGYSFFSNNIALSTILYKKSSQSNILRSCIVMNNTAINGIISFSIGKWIINKVSFIGNTGAPAEFVPKTFNDYKSDDPSILFQNCNFDFAPQKLKYVTFTNLLLSDTKPEIECYFTHVN